MTNAAVERSDSQRSQRSQGNGPRVSFNRDVHVKRIDLNPDRFHSLPSRKKHSPLASAASPASRPVSRSSSDASSKKPKKPTSSIFSLFSGRANKTGPHGSEPSASEPASGDIQWRRVGRSRSDVGASRRDQQHSNGPTAGIRKRNNSETDDSLPGKKKSVPLSPIIENPPRPNYFGQADVPSGDPASIAAGDAHHSVDDADIAREMHMHSSQLPADRLPLTKGVTVDGIVKRLSMDRFSPVPNLQSAGFSYTRPNDTKIVYAQVMRDIEAQRSASPQPATAAVAPRSTTTARDYGDRFAGDRRHRSPSPIRLRTSMSPARQYVVETSEPRSRIDEQPIVPIIRRVEYPEINELSNRRQMLESRLNQRRIGSAEQLDPPLAARTASAAADQPALYENQAAFGRDASANNGSRSPVVPPRRRWRVPSVERSAERPPYIEDCFDEPDGEQLSSANHRRPVEIATLRTSQGARNGARLPADNAIIDLGYIEDMANQSDTDTDTFGHRPLNGGAFHQNRFREKYRQEFEPKSLDSQFSSDLHSASGVHAPIVQRSVSPVLQHYHQQHQQSAHNGAVRTEYRYAEPMHSLRREPKTQRSFDRGDSGIERDYRKSSSGAADDFSTISRTWKSTPPHSPSADDDAANLKLLTESFLRRERQHCDRLLFARQSYTFRERSIDDGSHYDPRLDKYPTASSYRKYPSPSAIDYNANHTGAKRRSAAAHQSAARADKKTGGVLAGLDKVKQLFTGKKKSTAGSPSSASSSSLSASKKDKDRRTTADVRREDESRHSAQSQRSGRSSSAFDGQSHHHRHSGAVLSSAGNGLSILRDPKLSDIATRRRLSTPKASPLPSKRAAQQPSFHHTHKTTTHHHPHSSTTTSTLSKSSRTSASSLSRPSPPAKAAPKKAWYKSLERLTSPMRSSSNRTQAMRLSQSTNTLNKDSRPIGMHHDAPDRAHSMYPSHESTYRGGAVSQENLKPSSAAKISSKHLRFFGDTDLDSNPPTLSKGHSMGTLTRKRTPLSNLTASGPLHGSGPLTTAVDGHTGINNGTLPPAKPTRTGRKEFRSSSKHLHNISESASDVDETDRSYKPQRHQPSTDNHQTTVAELRTALKTRSRSSPVRRPGEAMLPSGGVATSTPFQRKYAGHDAVDASHFNYRSSSELDEPNRHRRRSRSPSAERHRKPPSGMSHVQHPQQRNGTFGAIDRRPAHGRNRSDRDSSGTEGDSSQQSIVYLHATTVGAIPQPHVLQSRRARSREELSSVRSSSLTGTGTAKSLKSSSKKSAAAAKNAAKQQPMTRSVSRSLSVLAPWSPRHRDGYEIDYAPEQQQPHIDYQKTLPNIRARKITSDRPSIGQKYAANSSGVDSALLSDRGGNTADRRPTASMLRHYREQDLRRETVSIPSRR